MQIGIVIGGGNIFRGLAASEQGMDRVTGDTLGMLATVMNSLALQDGLEKLGVPTRVMSAIAANQVSEPYIKRKAVRHMEKGRVVIFAGGTGNPYFSTDSAAALRALETGAEIVMKATNVDGVYDMDPKKFPQAKKYDEIKHEKALFEKLGVMDSSSIALCMDNNIPILVFSMLEKGNIKRAVLGEDIGTHVRQTS